MLYQALVAHGEKEGNPKKVGKRVFRTHFIVLSSTLSVQNYIKYIQEGTNFTWEFRVNTEEKLMYVSLKLQSSLDTLLGGKQNKQHKTRWAKRRQRGTTPE